MKKHISPRHSNKYFNNVFAEDAENRIGDSYIVSVFDEYDSAPYVPFPEP